MKKNKALFAISSLGLGHATRTLPIINYYLEKGFIIDIISYGNALQYLKTELGNKKVEFIEFYDYPALERGKGFKFYYYLIIDLIKTNIIIKKENNYVKTIDKNYDFIFSDGRYGVYSKKIKSYLLVHQFSFIMPKGLSLFSALSDIYNYYSFKKFDHIFIPDFSEFNNSLAGKLSHPKWINKLNYTYIGIISSFNFNEVNKTENKIDYLFTISGYLEEHKEDFVNKLLNEAKKIKGKKVFILGDTKNNYIKKLENDITIYSFISGIERKNLFLNAKIIISRAGYTTIMDCVELNKKVILFPTPNQTEQEYLAEFLDNRGIFTIGNEKKSFLELIKQANNSKTLESKFKTCDSIKKIDDLITKNILG